VVRSRRQGREEGGRARNLICRNEDEKPSRDLSRGGFSMRASSAHEKDRRPVSRTAALFLA
jgi:hypothetical protein